MNVYRKPMIFLINILVFTNCCSQNTIKCNDKYEKIVSDENLKKYMVKWVDDNLNNPVVNLSELTTFYRPSPAFFSFKDKNVNWNILGLNNKRRSVGIIGIDYRNFNDKKSVNSSLIKSIFFTDVPKQGILIKSKYASKFINKENEKYVKIINERVSLYCDDRLRD